MADVSGLSLDPGSSDEERIREKAREAQEQASSKPPPLADFRPQRPKPFCIMRHNKLV